MLGNPGLRLWELAGSRFRIQSVSWLELQLHFYTCVHLLFAATKVHDEGKTKSASNCVLARCHMHMYERKHGLPTIDCWCRISE